ncbi:hypothetical protein [Paraclostridium sordellii]|uniref:Cell shape-determining protein n=1 Tax=Paraclostridium sordellii TaxID=1505 RepID=A0A0A8W0W2_PARSO|nr:hypothetical protein [Paeniclostridium sordellii]MBX9181695.1 hypothetical protein [Paeniclostridium sordellii]CEK33486.1 cell shape-determining protein [[Clostridium] sordellii] [Paeniclostridium sordellii]CEN75533.1 cell shape-determining protein [[Clostridium] sordellii] [Paeniclostridium sordellii]CEN78760.1 cell shape-determining protein [[Clostridium] sordellii] [Paeniclostridium sordellii]CEO15021.1 cell shape-determining protein [[Clostridium] sordellii] [Paeniclostridium sordellii]
MKKFIKIYGTALIVVIIYAIIQLPVLRLDFKSLFSTGVIFFIVAGVLDMMLDRGEKTSRAAKTNFTIAMALIAYIIVIPFITSSPIIHSKAYRNLLGDVKESNFAKDVSPVSVNDIRLVDEEMAMKLGDKKIGEVPAIGSVSKLGKFHIQNIDGELYWVAPLVHRDIIKWVTNMSGTSGYVMVSASNPQDVRLVQEVDGKPIKIVYQPDAYLHQDLRRHMYLKGYVNVGMTDFTLEIDDKGKPYWIVTLYENAVGYEGKNAIGIATVDTQSGEVKSYDIKDAPKWIDRIQPQEFVTEQINDWGTYINGFLNSVISEKGVLVATEGTSLVYGEDGKSYWYTGITSAGADDSTIGFMLVDTRTKEAKLYKQPGATETAAMVSATGKVQEKNYDATFPVMYNILGKPTYVMSLKDKAGLVKMVAFVSVEDFNIVGIGDTKEEALRSYREQLKSKGNNVQVENDNTKVVKTGTVKRISSDVIDGNTSYYFTLEGINDSIFIVSSKVSHEVPLTKEGDSIKISYDKEHKGNIDILEFDNISMNQKEEQVQKEETNQ